MAPSTKIATGLHWLSGQKLEAISKNAIVAIAKVRDEERRLPFWLAYHRWLGVDHFIFLDNDSCDGTRELVRREPDVTLIAAAGPFSGPSGHARWIKTIVSAAPPHRWNLILDADELFVPFPWRQGGLKQTVSLLERDGALQAEAVMVDCYPPSLPIAAPFSQIPWERACWFDPGPYLRERMISRRLSVVYSGVRQRIFWPNWHWQRMLPKALLKLFKIQPPPFIIKAPLSQLRAWSGVHRAASAGANCFVILHYKLDADFEKSVARAVAEENYYKQAAEYKVYLAGLSRSPLDLKNDQSRRFTGLSSLVDADLFWVAAEWMDSESRVETFDVGVDFAKAEIALFGNI